MPSVTCGDDPETMLLDMLQSSSPYLVGSILLAVLAFAGSLIPGVAALLVAGATLADPWGVAVVAVAGCAGYVLYATGGWLVGRRYGSRLRHGGAGRRIGERRWSRAERLVTGAGTSTSTGTGTGLDAGTSTGAGVSADMRTNAGGGPALAVACFLPVVGSLVPIVAGTLSVPYTRFVRRALVGGAVWVSVHLSLGALAGEALRQNRHLLVPILACVAVVVAGLVVINHRARPPREGAGDGDAPDAYDSDDASGKILG